MFKSKVALFIAGLSFSIASMANQIGTSNSLTIEVPVASPSTLTSTFEPVSGLVSGDVAFGTIIGNIQLLTTGAGNINSVTISPNTPDSTFTLTGAVTNTPLPINIGSMADEVTAAIGNGNTTTTLLKPSQEQFLTVYATGTPVADVFSGNFTVSVYSL
ncbi:MULTISPECIES: hypothetical protein [Serratia]|uniref:hypothetical protein n=1 Tax=Serratia TaxID=613 RepID=UPI0004048175|nr:MULTISPECIES: hypothetical protein [Serratia]UAN62207.1 hypothetical protein KGP16_21945 [Serratia sp. JSRIV006]